MPNVIVNSCYIKSSQHFINYLEYAGNKLEAQTLVLNDGTRIDLDPDELVDISETPDFRYIQLELKDGTIRRLGMEKYQAYVNERTEGVTVNDVTADENFTSEDKGYLERSPEKYIDYIAFRPSVERNPNESHGLFGINGAVDIEAAKASVLENEKSIKWSHIISLTREGAEETGFDNRQAWENLIRAKAYDIGKLYNIPPEHLEIMAAYHDKAHHPHCHLFFYSNANTTKEGYAGFNEGDLAKKSEKLTSMMNNAIFKDQTSYLKEEKSRFREEMKEELRAYVLDIGQNGYTPDKEIVDSFLDLAESLSDYSGKANYKFLSPEQKQKVNDFLRIAVSSDGNLSEIYAKIIENQRSFITMYNDDQEKINARLEDFQNHFFEPTEKNDMRQLHNIIVKQVMQFNQALAPEDQPFSDDPAEDVVRKEKISFQEAKEDLAFAQMLSDSPEKEEILQSVLNVFESKADEGNSMAAYELGRHYELGTFGKKDSELSQQYFEKALSGFINELNSDGWLENLKEFARFRDNPDNLSQKDFEKGIYKFLKKKEQFEWEDNYFRYKIGKMLIDGIGAEKNILEGISYLEQSTLPIAHYTLGNLYYNSADGLDQDMQRAYEHYTHAGFPEEGNSMPFAIYNMAEMLEQELVADDRLSADYLYKKALFDFIEADNETPNDFIEYKIASMYLEGKGCEINKSIAEDYLIKSAKAGNRQAPIRLANLYFDNDLTEEGIRTLRIASSMNNSSASYLLGKIYLEGEIITREMDKAIEYITKAANQKNSFAAYKLGDLYSQGELVDQDKAAASAWYAKAYRGFIRISEDEHADPNDTVLYYLGNMNYRGLGTEQNIAKAIEYLTSAANLENGAAQFRLGSIYLEEKEFRDFDKTIHFLTKAADQENPFAAYKLGNLYSRDEKDFTGADKATADEWYSRAYKGFAEMIENDIKNNADPNDTVLYYLGNMNYRGLGTEQNIVKAIEYLTSAADFENGAAQFRLGSIYLEENYFRNLNKAVEYLTKSAEQDNPYAAYKLGKVYSEGKFFWPQEIFPNKAIADRWYAQAYEGFVKMIQDTDEPNDAILYDLGNMKLNGLGVDRNISEAIGYFSKAADLGNEFAQYRLGKIYLEGEFVLIDMKKALDYFKAAADQNNQYAQYEIGKIFYYGINNVPKNKNLAIEYFKKSAAQGNVYAQRKLQYIADEPRRKAAYAASLLLSRIAYVMSQMAMQNAYNNEQNREEEEKERNDQPRFASKNHQRSRSHLTVQTPIQF